MKKKGINYCKYISRNGYMKVIEVGNVVLICLSIVKLRDTYGTIIDISLQIRK